MRLLPTILAAAMAVAPLAAQAAEQITGAGSTFVYPVIAKWSQAYQQKTGVQLNYQSIGSGAGISQIKAGTVDFGATDMPLGPQELQQAGLAQFPSVIGGIVPVVNLDGVQPGQLRFPPALLADIYLGKVKNWNDPAIARANPGVKFPDRAIIVVHRSDGSGTTFNFSDYLSKVSPDWKQKVGEGTSVKWPTGVGGKGNEGVAAYVERIKGAIAYVEYAFVTQNKMTYGLVENAAGKYVTPNTRSFQAAAASADWKSQPDFDVLMTNAPGADAYPITATTFILMHRQPKNPQASQAALAFFAWAYQNGQQLAESLDYVPLPPSLVQQIESYWKQAIHS